VRFSVQRWIPRVPELTFALATHPESMNRWSEARIEADLPGEWGHVASVGATRFVHLPESLLSRHTRLEEVVVESRPPHRFVYRVIGGAPLAWHEGVQELEPRADPRGSGTAGTWLTWHVDARLDVPVPGADTLVRRQLEAGLRRSLEAMVTAAYQGVERQELARWTPPPEDDVATLRRDAEEAEGELREVHRRRRGDPRAALAGFFAELAAERLRAVREGLVRHPGWVLRLVPLSARYYLDALEGDDDGACEGHWREAFREAERALRTRPYVDASRHALRIELQAHLEEDLPRVLATTHADHYAGRHGFARFRADHRILGRSYAAAAERFWAAFPTDAWSWRDRARRALPSILRTPPMGRTADWLHRSRRRAFERGERLANLLVGAIRA
jgi:hypothetical protein